VDSTGAANLALGRVGVGQAIAALTDNTVTAKTCNRFFEQCRQEVLRAHPWGFALRAQPLAQVSAQTFPGWGYVYQYPDDCLTVRAIADSAGMRVIRDAFLSGDVARDQIVQSIKVPFQLALKDDGASQVILTDLADAWAFFTVDVDNTGVWPADFGSVFAWRLAMEIGGPLQAKAELVGAAKNEYLWWLSHATAASMNEQRDDTPAESPSITCRY
jgi:hypothetical protein